MADMKPFDYLCRICASDTKGKNSVAECVFVLKTAALKEKIEKYLDLTVSENDALPKVICKSCYRSVEGIVSLSKIAIHTQMVLSNFLKPHAALIEPDSEYTSFAISCKDYERSMGNALLAEPTAMSNPPPLQSKPKRPEEVVVNVSVSDPLTRETQQKIIGATRQHQQTMDTRFIPKSIAHRHVSFATSTPKDKEPSEATNLSVGKKSVPTGVINFYSPPQQQQQQVTVTSGGYVIGQIDTTSPKSKSTTTTSSQPILQHQIGPAIPSVPLPIITRSTTTSPNNKGRGSSDNEQKRNNLKMALKNIRVTNTINAGQVSLLKVSQKQQANATTKPPSSTKAHSSNTSRSDSPVDDTLRVRPLSPTIGRKTRKPQPQRRPTIAEIPTTAEALPKEIIIASVKKPKQSEIAELSQPSPRSNVDDVEAGISKSLFPDDIPLGRVIKDFDLLKLIMKALKWPVNKDNMEAQMTRLRNSKFTTIMSDQNLLQDTDLTQLLGPYLAPVLLAAQVLQKQQQQQQQHQQQQQQQQQQKQQQQQMVTVVSNPKKLKHPSPVAEIPTDLSASTVTNLASAIPYRLPPETSVQLVPASPEDEKQLNSPPHPSRKSTLPTKKTRRPTEPMRSRDSSIVISDGEEDAAANSNSNSRKKTDDKHKTKPPVDIEPIRTGAQRSSAGSNLETSYDIVRQINERNRNAMDRAQTQTQMQTQTQRKHANVDVKSTGVSAVQYPSFVDDIVLIEPESTKEKRTASPPKEFPRKKQTVMLPPVISLSSPDKLFNARALPPITRPIIKRRKTVIHASPAKTHLAQVNQKQQTASLSTTMEATAKQVSIKEPSLAAMSETALDAMVAMEKSESRTSEQSADTVKVTTPKTTSATTSNSTPLSRTTSKTAAQIETKTATKAASTTPAHPSASSKASSSTAETSTKTSFNNNNNNNKVSVSTSMSFFNAITTHTVTAVTSDKDLTPKKSASGSKAALAEQLLEAVGLKKSSSTTTEKSITSDSRESVQQIRSALKRSLKQAVEQNLRKHEEQPVIKQVADSTTKSGNNIVKDVNIEGKTKQHPDNILKPLTHTDFDDDIDRLSLVEQRSERQVSLLKSRNSSAIELEKEKVQGTQNQDSLKQRNVGRQQRKTSTQTSVIKKSVSTAPKHSEDSKSDIQIKTLDEENAFSGSLNEPSAIGGNAVSSTSETPNPAEVVPMSRKRGRKRKIEEETGGEPTEIAEQEVRKKEIKEEFDAEAIVVGDGESPKETSHTESFDKKLDSSGSSSRPSRVSKTMSKYYKGPDRQASTRSTRSARHK